MFFQRVLGLALLCASPALMAEDCEYSEWGRDDQIGAANRITPERTIAAASLVKTGASHPLGIVITPGMPAYPGKEGKGLIFDFPFSSVSRNESA